MISIRLPFTDLILMLSPRWSDMAAPAQVGLLLLVTIVPLILVVWLYRYEMRLIRRLAALGLLTLRILVLAFLLFMVCLQPVLGRPTTEVLSSRVIIAVDRSASGEVADLQRQPLEKLRLARALRLSDDPLIDEWIRHHESRGDLPPWTRPDEFPDDPEKRQQLADERRQKYEDVMNRVDALTRNQVAERILREDGIGLVKQIEKAGHQVEFIGFSQDAWDVDSRSLPDLFQPREGAGPRTDLRLPLLKTLERTGPGHGKVLGVVLLTDGQHNWKEMPVAKAIELAERKLPIYPVALGAQQAPPDVALTEIEAPATVFKDASTDVKAQVRVRGMPRPTDILVELRRPDPERPGQEIVETRTIAHGGGDADYPVRFSLKFDKAGTEALTMTVRPLDGEVRSDNNSRPARINVADDRARVLLVDGEARWEYHYLATALTRTPSLKVDEVLFEQPRLGRIAEEELRKTGNPALILPSGPDALADYDCIILGDVSPQHLPAAERERLEKYVAERGGTLVIIAGKRFMPHAYRRAMGDADRGEPLLNLLPIEVPQVIKPVEGFPLTLTTDGQEADFLNLEETPEESERRWAQLPRHYWGVLGWTKPGARPLAFLARPMDAMALAPGSRDRGDELEKTQTLIARHNYGFGRVLYLGLDSTWRWRFKVGDRYHHRFWDQVIRWAASDKPLVTGNAYVRFGTPEAVYSRDQEIDLVVRLSDELQPLRADALAGARILKVDDPDKPEQVVAVVPLVVREAQKRVLEGKYRDLPPGRYAVELAIPDLADKLQGQTGPDGKVQPLRASFTVTPPAAELEMIDLSTNWPLLEQLAVKSGGRVYTAETAGELLERLTEQTVTHSFRTERRLYQDWLTLILFLGLVSTEWIGRKLAGLP